MKKQMRNKLCFMISIFFCFSALLPVQVLAQESPPVVGAGAYAVIDADTGQVLVSKNGDNAGYPASITKILTLGLVLESVDYESKKGEIILASNSAIDALIPRASMIALGRGEAATLEDLLYATMLESANDAANVLAEYVSGSIEAFCQLMNTKAAALGLANSHFTNPSGQPEDQHFTTAKDMAAILKWAQSVPGFNQIFSSQTYSMGASNMQGSGRIFRNVNKISMPNSNFYYSGIVGSKTGYTDQARYTLASSAVRGDVKLICVVLNCNVNDEKYISTAALLDYCFNNFRRVNLPVANTVPKNVPVFGGGEKPLGEIKVFAQGDVSFLLHNSINSSDVQFVDNVPEKYVIGQAFSPSTSIQLGSVPQQDGYSQIAKQLVWTGLEEILEENTSFGAFGRIAKQRPALFWLGILLPALLALLFAGRIAFVQHRRNKRRQRRLLAARAQKPISIERRPSPPCTKVHANKVYRRPSTPKLRVASSAAANYPRRVGRAR